MPRGFGILDSMERRWGRMSDLIRRVDAVEVVRCRECKNGSQYDDGSDNYVCLLGGTKKGGGYCSDGKRRNDA